MDPVVVSGLPGDLAVVKLFASADVAAAGADVLVLATAWPHYKQLPAADVVGAMREKLVIDPDHFLSTWEALPNVCYVTIGRRK
jgi:predicted dinucleotide-binding enzyme